VPRGSRHGTGAFGMVRRETLLDSSPYAPGTSSSLSWSSGYIEGKAFRNGFIATPPGSRVPLRKNALAAEPALFRFAPLHSYGLSGTATSYPDGGGQISTPIDKQFRLASTGARTLPSSDARPCPAKSTRARSAPAARGSNLFQRIKKSSSIEIKAPGRLAITGNHLKTVLLEQLQHAASVARGIVECWQSNAGCVAARIRVLANYQRNSPRVSGSLRQRKHGDKKENTQKHDAPTPIAVGNSPPTTPEQSRSITARNRAFGIENQQGMAIKTRHTCAVAFGMRLKTQGAILARTASCVSSCGTSRPSVATPCLVVIAVDLLEEGLGVDCGGCSTGDAGDDRKRNQGGQDGLHDHSPLTW
jgi:hypothetical protein